jgi:hypothetical protein
MNPVLPHLRHNNLFLLHTEESKESSQNSGNYRRIFHQGVAYGPLIPPSSSVARAVMGNAGSHNDTGTRDSFEQKPSLSSESNVTQQQQQQQQSDRPRSNLSALMDQQQQDSRERIPEKSNARGPQHCAGPAGVADEADYASGPMRSTPSVQIPQRAALLKAESSTPPSALPTHVQPSLSKSNSQAVNYIDSSSDGKVRR